MKEDTLHPPTHYQYYQILYFSKTNLMTWSNNIQKNAVYQFKCFLPLVLVGLSAMESAVEVMQGGAILGSQGAKENSFPTDNWACQRL